MKVAAIIAEYNPFHNGHKYHIEQTKAITGADYVIAIISGNYVQRGEPAIIDKYTRTKMALNNGIDLVIELPTSYATASAEYFAYGSVSILHRLNCVDYLCFGSECNNIELMYSIAKILTTKDSDFSISLNNYIKKGYSFPKARQEALIEYLTSNKDSSVLKKYNINSTSIEEIKTIISSPNNILGIEYIKALIKLNSSIKPVTIKRMDSGYNETKLYPFSKLSSASSIRTHLQYKKNFRSLKKYVPKDTYNLLIDSYNKTFPIYYDDFSQIAFYTLLNEESDSLTNFLDVDSSIANKLIKNASTSNDISLLLDSIKSKDITYSRLSRALLHIILKEEKYTFKDYITDNTGYARILGFKSESSSLIKYIKKNSSINIINKLTLGKNNLSTLETKMLEHDILTSEIYNKIISLKYGTPCESEYKKGIIQL